MSFSETFIDLRARRRIPMRLFREQVGIYPSYIHGIEQEGVLPSDEKLEQLASVFVAVAIEQDAADPPEDSRALFRARETSRLEELGFDPELADSMLVVREMESGVRADLIAPLQDALAVYLPLQRQERRAIGEALARIRSLFESRNPAAANTIVAEIAGIISGQLQELEGRPDPAAAPEPVAETSG